jgi:AmmeMemoRadiSam system protein B
MNDRSTLAPLRALEITPLWTEERELYFALYDPTRIASRPIAVSPVGYFVLTCLDGRHTCQDVQNVFRRRFGLTLPAEQIEGLVAALDEALMLDNERFARAYAACVDEYRSSAVRDNRARWPAPETLRAEIRSMLVAGRAEPTAAPAGLIAPHLDYARGGPCYADAYAALGRFAPAERYVILGTNHFGRSDSVVATRKDFLTPLGLVRTDVGFIERLERRLGQSVCAGEFDHLAEHSVELQVHILQVTHEQQPFEIVPVLCPDPSGPSGTRPASGQGPDLGDFADALAAELAADPRPTVLIASADLSHVGQRFGDPQPTTAEFLERVARSDQELLSLLTRRREEDFVHSVRVAGNPTRICSVGCIYTLLRALPGHPVHLLRYHQAVDMAAETHVTCAAATVG